MRRVHLARHRALHHISVRALLEAREIDSLDDRARLVAGIADRRPGSVVTRVENVVVGPIRVVEMVVAQCHVQDRGRAELLIPIEPVRRRVDVLIGQPIRIQAKVVVVGLPLHQIEQDLVAQLHLGTEEVGDLPEPRPFGGVAQSHVLSVAGGIPDLLLEIRLVSGHEAPGGMEWRRFGGIAGAQEIARLGAARERAAHRRLVVLGARRVRLEIDDPALVPGKGEATEERLGGPLEVLGALLQHRIHHPAHRLPILCIERSVDHLHFAEHRAVERQGGGVIVGIVDAGAIDLELDLSQPPAAEVAVDHPRLQIDDILQILHRQLLDLLARQARPGVGEIEIDGQPLGADHDLPGGERRLLDHAVDLSGLVGGDDHVANDQRLVTDEGDLDRVLRRRNVDDVVDPVRAGNAPERRAHDRDRRPGKRLLLAVDHLSADLPRGSRLELARSHGEAEAERKPPLAPMPVGIGPAPALAWRASRREATYGDAAHFKRTTFPLKVPRRAPVAGSSSKRRYG